MSDYLFVQSQDPFTETQSIHQYQLARDLAEAGHSVVVLLVQNGVAPARVNTTSDAFDTLLHSKVKVLADGFSLQQWEINRAQLKDGIHVADVSAAVDALLAGHKVIWH
jgi:intracellular sulfur oxidation DsrE/DsrF family protein